MYCIQVILMCIYTLFLTFFFFNYQIFFEKDYIYKQNNVTKEKYAINWSSLFIAAVKEIAQIEYYH